MTEASTASAIDTTASTDALEQQPPILTLDGVSYAFDQLSERARMLSLDCLRTDQEWAQLLHRYRQFIAMEATVVNQLKQEVEQSDLQPLSIDQEAPPRETPLLTIDATSYDATAIPDNVRLYVEDLVRNNQERQQLEFRLRQLDAARTTYQCEIRQELENSGAEAITPSTTQGELN